MRTKGAAKADKRLIVLLPGRLTSKKEVFATLDNLTERQVQTHITRYKKLNSDFIFEVASSADKAPAIDDQPLFDPYTQLTMFIIG